MLRAREPAPNPSAAAGSGGLGEVVGNRKLIALGALLGWLLVVHLLVNIWLLCLLSGVLALLGGWLGSRAAAVGTSSRLHLERFLLFERWPPSPEAEKQLDEEIGSVIRKVIRDFVSSWYRAVSTERGFEDQVENAMTALAMELKRRMALVDKRALTQKVLLLGGRHLETYKKAREAAAEVGQPGGRAPEAEPLWRAYSEWWHPHVAVLSPGHEVDYARRIVDLLLQVLVPRPHLDTRTGRFVVVELVTCNVLLPMINKMSDPDWLNLLLIAIVSKMGGREAGEKETDLAAAVPAPALPQAPMPNSLPLVVQAETTPEARMVSPRSSEPSVGEGPDGLEGHGLEGREPMSRELSTDMARRRVSSLSVSSLQPETLGSFFPCEDLDIESPMSDVAKDPGCAGLVQAEEFFLDTFNTLPGPDGLDHEDSQGGKSRSVDDHAATGLEATSVSPCPDIQIEPAVEDEATMASLTALLENSEKLFLTRPSSLEKEATPADSLARTPQDLGQLSSLLSSSPTAPMGTFSFEPLSSPDGPILIQNLRITGTITAREHSGTGFHPYTLYTVKVRI